jgi:hypothetical protein
MHIITHTLIGFLAALSLFFMFPSQISLQAAVIIFLSGVLIDLDHVVYYLIMGGNPKSDFKNSSPHFYFFHTIEFVLILAALSCFYQTAFLILIGSLIHLMSDIISYLYCKNYRWLSYWSAIHYFLVKNHKA